MGSNGSPARKPAPGQWPTTLIISLCINHRRNSLIVGAYMKPQRLVHESCIKPRSFANAAMDRAFDESEFFASPTPAAERLITAIIG